MTEVVNVKVAYIRPEYNNLEDWIQNINNVYIGRAGVVFIDKKRFPSTPSPFCNPFKDGKDGTREEIIQKYEIYIREKLENSVELRSMLLEMKNKKLGCWCKPLSCHGDVLIKLIEEYSK